jgi:hypothetical protein
VRVITNEPLIANRSRWAQGLSLSGLAILLGGTALSWFSTSMIDLPLLGQVSPFFISWTALLVGYVLTQASLYLANRYGVRYQPHQLMDHELAALDDRYIMLHHTHGLEHVLLAPSGAYVITARHNSGLIRFKDGQWRHDIPLKWLRMAFQEGLGNPSRDALVAAQDFAQRLDKLGLPAAIAVHPLIVFYNPGAQVQAEGSDVPAVHVQKLRGYLRGLEQRYTDQVSNALLEQAANQLAGPLAGQLGAARTAAHEAAADQHFGKSGKVRRTKRKGK